MNLTKYQNLLLNKIKSQFSLWFETDEKESISNSEVYRFLHSIKGTSGTLELVDIYTVSKDLLEEINDGNKESWERKELKQFLCKLIILTENFGIFEDAEVHGRDHSQADNTPLIQVIGNDISNLIFLKDFLEKKGWMVISNSTTEKAISQFLDLNPDCVIINENSPSMIGFETIQALRPYSSKQFVPIIMISKQSDKKTRINALKLGADDFLEKPLDLEELTVRIEHHLQRKKLFEQSALIDDLTKLYNRRYFNVAFNRNMNDLKRNGQPFCLAMLDIDFFKKVNDHYGHPTGDMVLSKFAALLKEGTRNTDIAFRYGGEEFIILFQHTSDLETYEVITRLLEDFSKIRFEANGEEFSVSFSAGIHMINAPETTIDAALNFVDQALYKAKESGRARVEYTKNPAAEFENRKLYISVLDDVSIIRSMLIKELQTLKIDHYDIDVQAFKNGPTFLLSNRLKQRGVHFLILDGVMPEMDGLEVLEKVKQTKTSNHILVMMLTGRNSKDDITKALELGADDYMTKPFNIEDLHSRIKKLIYRNHNQGFDCDSILETPLAEIET